MAKKGHTEEQILWGCRQRTADAVWFGETIAHLFDAHSILTEFNRVLRTEGTLILTTPYHGLVKNLSMVLFEFERILKDVRIADAVARELPDSRLKIIRWLSEPVGFEICFVSVPVLAVIEVETAGRMPQEG